MKGDEMCGSAIPGNTRGKVNSIQSANVPVHAALYSIGEAPAVADWYLRGLPCYEFWSRGRGEGREGEINLDEVKTKIRRTVSKAQTFHVRLNDEKTDKCTPGKTHKREYDGVKRFEVF
ncbi:hypothetical protein PPACK8108_LOCUS10305 [Phakopsora pachyrhizi]|uniref:Uncharacterized protein n=1 Tax=Phakopsora pachyrhizi TaxID=170000 RepID=A0AAV0B0Y2_PHAPC|nr:hypothetical protein PPACK8108_LOCUS10305 [Phakopsora pachyrhizi]